jgi:hypothetical protein
MDPLVILGAFGKLVNALLVHCNPAGNPQLAPDERLHAGEIEAIARHDNPPQIRQLNREKSGVPFFRGMRSPPPETPEL